MSTTAPNTVSQTAFFIKFLAWLDNPKEVASICPSSGALTSFIADRPIVARAKLVVDLGPANGETSRDLLRHMNARSTLIAIEKNSRLAQFLSQIGDSRLIAINDDACNLSRHLNRYLVGRPNVIVSGIPFSSLEPIMARLIMHSIYTVLQPGGQFIAYQLRKTVAKYASQYFSRPEVSWVYRNFPPLRVFVWTKPDQISNF